MPILRGYLLRRFFFYPLLSCNWKKKTQGISSLCYESIKSLFRLDLQYCCRHFFQMLRYIYHYNSKSFIHILFQIFSSQYLYDMLVKWSKKLLYSSSDKHLSIESYFPNRYSERNWLQNKRLCLVIDRVKLFSVIINARKELSEIR